MRRFIAVAAVAAVMVGCSDARTAAVSDRITGPSFSQGTPPPPPFPGAGSGFFATDGGESAAAAAATVGSPPDPCRASTGLQFSYRYFQNKPGNNAWLDLDFGGSKKGAHFHEVSNKNQEKTDGNGEISGLSGSDAFTYRIDDASGSLLPAVQDEGSRVPRYVSLHLMGTLTINGQSCRIGAQLDLSLFSGE